MRKIQQTNLTNLVTCDLITKDKKALMQYLPAATKLGQGNVFTGICDSVNRGGCLPQCMLGYPPRVDTPLGADTPAQEQTPPRSRHTPPEQTPPPEHTPPQSRHPPGKQTPAYGQRAAGTHPTGMHSCLKFLRVASSGTQNIGISMLNCSM